MTFQAFADDCSSYTLGNLTFENNADYLSVYGDIQIQRDQQGLQHLLALQQIIHQAVTDTRRCCLAAPIGLPPSMKSTIRFVLTSARLKNGL